jgi:hypothetical protein
MNDFDIGNVGGGGMTKTPVTGEVPLASEGSAT